MRAAVLPLRCRNRRQLLLGECRVSKNSWDLSPPLSVEICVREIQSIPEASLLMQGHCNRYRSSLAGCDTIDAGIPVVWEPQLLFGRLGVNGFEDMRLNRVSLREQHQMQVALPSETTK